jgi:hypothetical protein
MQKKVWLAAIVEFDDLQFAYRFVKIIVKLLIYSRAHGSGTLLLNILTWLNCPWSSFRDLNVREIDWNAI